MLESTIQIGMRMMRLPKSITIAEIAIDVAAAHNVLISDLRGKSRVKPLVDIRHEAMAKAYRTGLWSSREVGKFFNRDYSTVLYAAGCTARGRKARKHLR